jgi:hypothetical protein
MKQARDVNHMTRALDAELAAVAEVMPGWGFEVRRARDSYYVAALYRRKTDDPELDEARTTPRIFGHSPSVAALRHWLRAFAIGVRAGKWVSRRPLGA